MTYGYLLAAGCSPFLSFNNSISNFIDGLHWPLSRWGDKRDMVHFMKKSLVYHRQGYADNSAPGLWEKLRWFMHWSRVRSQIVPSRGASCQETWRINPSPPFKFEINVNLRYINSSSITGYWTSFISPSFNDLCLLYKLAIPHCLGMVRTQDRIQYQSYRASIGMKSMRCDSREYIMLAISITGLHPVDGCCDITSW